MSAALGERCDGVAIAANIARGPRTRSTSGHAAISAVTRAMKVRRGVVDRARDTMGTVPKRGLQYGPLLPLRRVLARGHRHGARHVAAQIEVERPDREIGL